MGTNLRRALIWALSKIGLTTHREVRRLQEELRINRRGTRTLADTIQRLQRLESKPQPGTMRKTLSHR